MKILHFTLGPVQGFVAQARRTRDLWSGSFLLSYLTGHAMKAVIKEGGRIIFPEVGTKENPKDPLLAAIMKSPLPKNPEPGIGSLPNRFKAEVPEDFEGEACKRAVQDEWAKIADVVWRQCVGRVEDLGNGTRGIWNRQVRGFWDMGWVLEPDPGDGSDNAWLDRRKNWRTYRPPPEPGDKCTLMSNWQELSGFVSSARERVYQDTFWDEVREEIEDLNLGDHERLCAISTIKRLFPDVARKAIGWELEAARWPSTPYMAAVPWIEKAHDKAGADEYPNAVRAAGANRWAFGKFNKDLRCLQNAERFAGIDGNYFHKAALENENATQGLSEDGRSDLLERLRGIAAGVGHPPSSFYALLLMDGDSLGILLQTLDSGKVSRALAHFTAGVEETVREHCGKTVYAGGDDVLALLPLDRALKAATRLREGYLEAFDRVLGNQRPVKTSISAGLVYAHYNTSMRAAMREAHRLLDDVAKDGNGRDSIAASVLTSSGKTVQWVSGWAEKTAAGKSIPDIVEELGKSFEEEFAGGFFYNVRQRFKGLSLEGPAARRLLVAEYQKSREQKAPLADVEDRVDRLLRVCRKRRGDEEQEEPDSLDDVSGAMLVRFLATKGRGVER